MKRYELARRLFHDDRSLQLGLLVLMALLYGVLLFDAGVHKQEWRQNLTFNSMLDHLTRLQFDVDPGIVGGEGYLRNGKVYAYWGITGALLRLPLLAFHRLDLDVTRLSCLVAVCLAGIIKVRTLLLLRRSCGPTTSAWAFSLMLAYVVLGGAEIAYLRSNIFQEVVFWAVAFAAIFVYFALKGIVSGQFTVDTLSWMACAAGLALLTRVSTGMGLYAALGLLMLVLLMQDFRLGRIKRAGKFLLPTTILAVFVILVGAVNYNRWGDPWTFSGGFYVGYEASPERLIPLRQYGLFNLNRVPLGLIYYFFPIWVLHGPDGRLFFEGIEDRLMDSVELPPSSFFLTDLLPIVFIVLLAVALWRSRQSLLQRFRNGWELAASEEGPTHALLRPFFLPQIFAVAAGLAVPCALMLSFLWMNYRYRMEFYPEMDFLAFLGFAVSISDRTLIAVFNRYRLWMLAATLISIASAFAAMILYKLSPWGSAPWQLHDGLVHLYMHRLSSHLSTN